MIICAAIKIIKDELYGVKLDTPEELIICGRRHGDCLIIIEQLTARWCGHKQIEGFLDHKGQFLPRDAAYVQAKACGQLSATTLWYKQDHGHFELYSEGLW
jgi:hypothetical protein